MNGRIERARLLMSQSRYDRAADELREVLAADPSDPLALALLALCHAGLDASDEAVPVARAAVAATPDEPFCHYALGCVLHGADDSTGAYAAAEEALRLDPDAPHHWGLLAALHLGRRRWSEALDAANRGLDKSRTPPSAPVTVPPASRTNNTPAATSQVLTDVAQ